MQVIATTPSNRGLGASVSVRQTGSRFLIRVWDKPERELEVNSLDELVDLQSAIAQAVAHLARTAAR